MRLRGLQGVRRGKAVRTTVPDAKAACPLDRVNRQFKADMPNQLWVEDTRGGRVSRLLKFGVVVDSRLSPSIGSYSRTTI